MKTTVGLTLVHIKPLQKPTQLPLVKFHDLAATLRPTETILLQTLLPKAETIAVPVQHLHHIPAPVAEDKKMSGEGIKI